MKLHSGVGTVLAVGLVAIGAGLALWFVADISGQIAWMVSLVAFGITACMAAMGVYLDRVQRAEHDEYIENLHIIVDMPLSGEQLNRLVALGTERGWKSL